jgi:hypothetical protein
MFDLFDFAWGCAMRRNMERTLRRSDCSNVKCERAIRRLYLAGESLPYHEGTFFVTVNDVLSKSLPSRNDGSL